VRALVIGDIHTEDDLLATALAHGAAAGVERILSVGDIVDGRGDPVACIARLRAARADVVRGNHERWVVEGHPLEPFDYPDDVLDWLAELPPTREYETPTGRLLLGHGLGTDDMRRLEPDTRGYALECLDALWALVRGGRYRWLVGGHTHIPMVRTVERGGNRLTVVNPGTLVMLQGPGFVIADFGAGRFERWALLPVPRLVETIEVAP
jgi:predicted phosphodiesterase